MADRNFNVRNGLTVNNALTVNSTATYVNNSLLVNTSLLVVNTASGTISINTTSNDSLFKVNGTANIVTLTVGNGTVTHTLTSANVNITANLTYGGTTFRAVVSGSNNLVGSHQTTFTGNTVTSNLTISANLTYGGVTLRGGTTGSNNLVASHEAVLTGNTTISNLTIAVGANLTYGGTVLRAGVTGSNNLVASHSPTFTGFPLAPTPTANDNSTKLATTAYVDTSVLATIPVGTVMPYAGNNEPTGWLYANGQVLSNTSTYNALYNVIGSMYNIGSESVNTFRVPDLRSRVIAGRDNRGASNLLTSISGIDANNMGSTGGSETAVAVPSANTGQGTDLIVGVASDAINVSQSGHTHTLPNSNPFGIAQPTIILNYIIKY